VKHYFMEVIIKRRTYQKRKGDLLTTVHAAGSFPSRKEIGRLTGVIAQDTGRVTRKGEKLLGRCESMLGNSITFLMKGR